MVSYDCSVLLTLPGTTVPFYLYYLVQLFRFTDVIIVFRLNTYRYGTHIPVWTGMEHISVCEWTRTTIPSCEPNTWIHLLTMLWVHCMDRYGTYRYGIHILVWTDMEHKPMWNRTYCITWTAIEGTHSITWTKLEGWVTPRIHIFVCNESLFI